MYNLTKQRLLRIKTGKQLNYMSFRKSINFSNLHWDLYEPLVYLTMSNYLAGTRRHKNSYLYFYSQDLPIFLTIGNLFLGQNHPFINILYQKYKDFMWCGDDFFNIEIYNLFYKNFVVLVYTSIGLMCISGIFYLFYWNLYIFPAVAYKFFQLLSLSVYIFVLLIFNIINPIPVLIVLFFWKNIYSVIIKKKKRGSIDGLILRVLIWLEIKIFNFFRYLFSFIFKFFRFYVMVKLIKFNLKYSYCILLILSSLLFIRYF